MSRDAPEAPGSNVDIDGRLRGALIVATVTATSSLLIAAAATYRLQIERSCAHTPHYREAWVAAALLAAVAVAATVFGRRLAPPHSRAARVVTSCVLLCGVLVLVLAVAYNAPAPACYATVGWT
jgi:hypothetical protein